MEICIDRYYSGSEAKAHRFTILEYTSVLSTGSPDRFARDNRDIIIPREDV
jgi:hypothetical protein